MLPNGLRISGAEGVRCMRGLGNAPLPDFMREYQFTWESLPWLPV